MRLNYLVLLACLAVPSQAFALPGEYAAIIRHCGAPDAWDREGARSADSPDRTLGYGPYTLQFEAVEGGLSFKSGLKYGELIARQSLESGLPCFRDALMQVAAAPRQAADPTIRSQVAGHTPGGFLDTPYIWLIIALSVVLLLFMFLPAVKRRVPERPVPRTPLRKPEIVEEEIRRRSGEHRVSE